MLDHSGLVALCPRAPRTWKKEHNDPLFDISGSRCKFSFPQKVGDSPHLQCISFSSCSTKGRKVWGPLFSQQHNCFGALASRLRTPLHLLLFPHTRAGGSVQKQRSNPHARKGVWTFEGQEKRRMGSFYLGAQVKPRPPWGCPAPSLPSLPEWSMMFPINFALFDSGLFSSLLIL